MVRSARARPKGRCSHSAPQDLDATALRLDSTGHNAGVETAAAAAASAASPTGVAESDRTGLVASPAGTAKPVRVGGLFRRAA